MPEEELGALQGEEEPVPEPLAVSFPEVKAEEPPAEAGRPAEEPLQVVDAEPLWSPQPEESSPAEKEAPVVDVEASLPAGVGETETAATLPVTEEAGVVEEIGAVQPPQEEESWWGQDSKASPPAQVRPAPEVKVLKAEAPDWEEKEEEPASSGEEEDWWTPEGEEGSQPEEGET